MTICKSDFHRYNLRCGPKCKPANDMPCLLREDSGISLSRSSTECADSSDELETSEFQESEFHVRKKFAKIAQQPLHKSHHTPTGKFPSIAPAKLRNTRSFGKDMPSFDKDMPSFDKDMRGSVEDMPSGKNMRSSGKNTPSFGRFQNTPSGKDMLKSLRYKKKVKNKARIRVYKAGIVTFSLLALGLLCIYARFTYNTRYNTQHNTQQNEFHGIQDELFEHSLAQDEVASIKNNIMRLYSEKKRFKEYSATFTPDRVYDDFSDLYAAFNGILDIVSIQFAQGKETLKYLYELVSEIETRSSPAGVPVKSFSTKLEKRLDDRLNFLENKINSLAHNLASKDIKSLWEHVGAISNNLEELKKVSQPKLEPKYEPKFDHALYDSGASVELSLTSKTFASKGRQNLPEIALSEGTLPGQCWGMQGQSGIIAIRLRQAIIPNAVEVEHTSLSPYGKNKFSSSPRKMEAWAVYNQKKFHKVVQNLTGNLDILPDELLDSGKNPIIAIRLSKMEFDPYLSSKMQFKLAKKPVTLVNKVFRETSSGVDLVAVLVLSNWGEKDYTCIYKIRIYGDILDS